MENNIVYMDLKDGRVVIKLMPEVAPNHVAQFKKLVEEKFYDGLTFHRVIDKFMVQGGDPTGTGSGGSGKNIRAEFSNEPHTRGAVSMARSMNINSADSQFFIVTHDSRFLDKQYTIFGRVIEGMEFVDLIKKGEDDSGMVTSPSKIVSMKIAKDTVEKSDD